MRRLTVQLKRTSYFEEKLQEGKKLPNFHVRALTGTAMQTASLKAVQGS